MTDEYLLVVNDLHVFIGDKEILRGVNLKLRRGEVHAIFGPNGSGKTTLLHALMGFSGYKVQGEIIFDGRDITQLPINERAQLGIGISFQRPPAIRGVKLRRLIETTSKGNGKVLDEYSQALKLADLLDREVNVGFSGGEIKRAELLQLIMQDPRLILLDEPESGVDLENIALIGEYTNHLLGRRRGPNREKTMKELYREGKKSGLIITHSGYILDYVNVDVGYILMNGRITCQANPRDMLHTIREYGFEECNRCCQTE